MAKEPTLEGILWTLTEAIVRRTMVDRSRKTPGRIPRDQRPTGKGPRGWFAHDPRRRARSRQPRQDSAFVLETERRLWTNLRSSWRDGRMPSLGGRFIAPEASRWRFIEPDELRRAWPTWTRRQSLATSLSRRASAASPCASRARIRRELAEPEIEHTRGQREARHIYVLAIEKLIDRTITEGGERTSMHPKWRRSSCGARFPRCPTDDEKAIFSSHPLVRPR